MLTIAIILLSLLASVPEQNFGYKPNPQATEGFVRRLHEHRQADREKQDAEAVDDYLRRQPRSVASSTFRRSPGEAFVVLSLCFATAVTCFGAGAYEIVKSCGPGGRTANGVSAVIFNVFGASVLFAGFFLAF